MSVSLAFSVTDLSAPTAAEWIEFMEKLMQYANTNMRQIHQREDVLSSAPTEHKEIISVKNETIVQIYERVIENFQNSLPDLKSKYDATMTDEMESTFMMMTNLQQTLQLMLSVADKQLLVDAFVAVHALLQAVNTDLTKRV